MFPIKAAAQRSGLSTHAIRAWERRYRAVAPMRGESGRRLYTEADIDRLCLLREATQSGLPISRIATLSRKELQDILGEGRRRSIEPPAGNPAWDDTAALEAALAAIRGYDSAALESLLQDAVRELGLRGMLKRLTIPLTEQIGVLWHTGRLRVAQEHFASNLIRQVIQSIAGARRAETGAPLLVLGTPTGQQHELGAVIIAAAAACLGWRVNYLGPSLPAIEIASAAVSQDARALGLSIIYPPDDTDLAADLLLLRQHLPAHIHLLAGGAAAPAYADSLRAAGFTLCQDVEAFEKQLQAIRGARSS